MKKFLLITFVASMFATGSAFAHCGSCGVGDKSHDHGAKMEESAKACTDSCAKKATCTKDDKAACTRPCAKDCSKPCCTKAKAEDETAAAPAPACCSAGKASKPA